MKKSIFERFPNLQTIPEEKFPKHICIIPDGNGRWAKSKNKFVTFGHRKGFQVAEDITTDLSEIKQIKIVTLWGFAVDNWKRSKKEITGLMFIFQRTLKKVLRDFNKNNRKFVHIGRKDRLPVKLSDLLRQAEESTKKNTGQILCLALDFGGEDQALRVIEAARKLPSDIPTTFELMWSLRDGQGIIPYADLLIRSSGEKRTSDIGWINGISTELFFIEKLFPDLTTADIINGIIDFSQRERRFGGRK